MTSNVATKRRSQGVPWPVFDHRSHLGPHTPHHNVSSAYELSCRYQLLLNTTIFHACKWLPVGNRPLLHSHSLTLQLSPFTPCPIYIAVKHRLPVTRPTGEHWKLTVVHRCTSCCQRPHHLTAPGSRGSLTLSRTPPNRTQAIFGLSGVPL